MADARPRDPHGVVFPCASGCPRQGHGGREPPGPWCDRCSVVCHGRSGADLHNSSRTADTAAGLSREPSRGVMLWYRARRWCSAHGLPHRRAAGASRSRTVVPWGCAGGLATALGCLRRPTTVLPFDFKPSIPGSAESARHMQLGVFSFFGYYAQIQRSRPLTDGPPPRAPSSSMAGANLACSSGATGSPVIRRSRRASLAR
jgi:hypothetical protein